MERRVFWKGIGISSIMRTVESSLTNAVKRFGGRICDGYWNKGTKTRQARQPEAQALGVPEPLV